MASLYKIRKEIEDCVDRETGKIIPYEGGFKFMLSGFNPENMRKKLAMVDEAKAKAARDARTA